MNVDDEKTAGGSAILRHGQAHDWTPPAGEECLEQTSAHIEAHLGPVASVFHELVSDRVHIDVHFVKPTPASPYIRLVTSGMSDLPMATPPGEDVPRHLELMITLPRDWRLDSESFKDPAWYWPVSLVKSLARLPHLYDTWLGWGHTVPNGDPAEPYAHGTGFAGAIVLPSITVPSGFRTLDIDADKQISFLSVWPLHPGEMDYKLAKGTDALIDRFQARGVTDAVDPARKDATRKRFGLF
jgi:Suppressor of fused protein (SUFU)